MSKESISTILEAESRTEETRGFMEAGKERMTRDTVRDATRAEVDGLKRENERLKQLVADLSLKVHILKKPKYPVWSKAEAPDECQ